MSTATASESPRRIRIGVIGLGLIAQAVHLQNLSTLRDLFEIVHVCDISQPLLDRMSTQLGGPVRATTDPSVLLADDAVEAVLILTPGVHAGLATEALRAGRDVFAEKPLASTAEEASAAAELARASGRILQVGYMKMYEPMVARMRDELDKLGEVALVRVTVLHPANEPQSAHQPPLRVADPALASRPRVSAEDYAVLERAVAPLREPYVTMYRTVFLASLSHEISLLRAIFGEAEADIAYAQVGEATKASLRSGDPLPAPPQVQALGRLGSAQLSISWNWSPGQPEYVEVLEIVGENGSLSLSLPGPYLRDHQAVLRVVRMEGDTGVESFLRGDHRTAFVRELEAFHESIVTRSEPLSTADGAAYDADLLLQIVRAVARST